VKLLASLIQVSQFRKLSQLLEKKHLLRVDPLKKEGRSFLHPLQITMSLEVICEQRSPTGPIPKASQYQQKVAGAFGHSYAEQTLWFLCLLTP
jgi:hypothetical protein